MKIIYRRDEVEKEIQIPKVKLQPSKPSVLVVDQRALMKSIIQKTNLKNQYKKI